MLKKLWDLLQFDKQIGEYELLETEGGEPGGRKQSADFHAAAAKPDDELLMDCSLAVNEERIKVEFRTDINPDVVLRRFKLGGEVDALAVYMTGMADTKNVSSFILREGMRPGTMAGVTERRAQHAAATIFTMGEAVEEKRWSVVKLAILEGRTAVIIEGDENVVLMDTRGFEHRSVTPPQSEHVVKGPQEGFSEALRTNITLLRRMIHTSDFVCEIRDAGGENNLMVAILYREGITNITLVEEVKRKLAEIQTRVVLSNGIIEQLTERHAFSPFPQLLSTERPDRTAAAIMDGHVAVLLDGSPFANVMPTSLFMLMASPEDVNLRQPQGTVIRFVRYMGAILSLVLPAYFVALALHHQGLLSTEVLTTVIASRKMVFLPIQVEMLLLLMVFQLIREAGTRVPGTVGQSVGIIGGLILGQAAVSANLASSVVLIIIALTGLGNFCIPDFSTQLAASYIRVIFFLAAWAAGLMGLASAIIVFMTWICSLKSYGVPFLSPHIPKADTARPMILRGRVVMRKKADDVSNTSEEHAL